MTPVSVAFKKPRVFSIHNIEMTPVSVAFKKPRVFSIRNIKIILIPNSLKKYREYYSSVISVSDRFFMVLVVYKGSYISVSDRFLFKKRFYFDICICFILVFSNGNYISLVWDWYIFGMGIIYRLIFYGTGSVQGFLHLGFRPIFI
jgi:hypothetical protein